MTYPPPDKRKYKFLTPYRDCMIGCYIDLEKPIIDVVAPSHQVYFPLDEFGDPVLPVDMPFWSPVLAACAIDMHHHLGGDKAVYGKTGGPWTVMHQNYQLQRFLPALADTLRTIQGILEDPKLESRYMDADDLADAIKAKLAPLWRQMNSAGPLREDVRGGYDGPIGG